MNDASILVTIAAVELLNAWTWLQINIQFQALCLAKYLSFKNYYC